jgi:replicative DNA helicase
MQVFEQGASNAPPANDPNAEAAVLSAILIRPAVFDELRDEVDATDFFSMSHRWLFEALVQLDAAGEEIDVVTVAHRLQASGRLKEIGGTPFLAAISDATPTVANVVAHARIVRHFGSLRRMTSTLRSLSILAHAPETRADVDGFLERCEAEVFAAHVTTERDTGSSLREVMATATTSLSPEQPNTTRGVSTGNAALDELTLGLVPGELWYVAARPGMGKTALALGISASVASNGGHAACFSMEMKRPELAERLISSDSGVPLKALQKRELSGEQWSRVTHTLDRLSRLPMVLDDASTLTPSRLRSRVRRHAAALRAQHPHGKLELVVVDYVQLMAWDKPNGNRNDELERISRALKILAGEFGLTVLALAQLNRGVKDRADKRPGLLDLRGSGALEQDADKVLFVHRDEHDERGDADLILAKGRNAALGVVGVRWEPWCVRFCEQQQGLGFRSNPRGDDFGPERYD